MKILVIGAGGREHAIAWKLAQSPKCSQVIVASGNAGTQLENKVININLIKIDDLVKYAIDNEVDFTVVGPEAPLSLGIVDTFRAHNLAIWGPTKYCARLESSKAFAKDFMVKYNIPTAKYSTFDNYNDAVEYLNKQNIPIVIKADGLAAGKGVLVANTLDEAINFVKEIFQNNLFGDSGSKVVIEEFLDGIEASFIVMVDGKNILPMATSQDHKRLLNGNNGPNTGGMGAYSPAPIVTDAMHERVMREIIQPVINGMKKDGHEYTGFLYAGIMIDKYGIPKTLEFNCRSGDPETQPIMMRLDSDLVEIIECGLLQQLNNIDVKWKNQYAVGVVLASGSYPASSKQQYPIRIGALNSLDSVKIFHSGTTSKNGTIYTAGGRVLCVVALGENIKSAQQNVYNTIKQVNFEGMQYRTDIGDKA